MIARFIYLALAVLPSLLCAEELPTAEIAGGAIYRTAIGLDGEPVPAVVQFDVPLPPAAAACTNCHRRSGLGISEGGSRSLNITAPALFHATDKPPIRPAYDDATLIRAIVAGVDADGRVLDPTMPRYELGATDAAALLAFLRELGSASEPGVSDNELTIATVVADSAPADEQAAVIEVMERFVELKNMESRRETKRAAASDRHYYGRVKQRAHRTWKLRVWELEGRPSTWDRQLQAYYDKEPVFAVVSGTTGNSDGSFHEFCERQEVPCILPLDPAPPLADTDFYSLYFSSGAYLEARVIATHLARGTLPEDSHVTVVSRGNAGDVLAFNALAEALQKQDIPPPQHRVVSGKQPISARKWQSVLRKDSPAILVALLDTDSISNLDDAAIDPEYLPSSIYTADTWSNWSEADTPPETVRTRLRHVHPYALPFDAQVSFPREYLWLKQRDLAHLDPLAASKVLYACRVLGVGLADIQTNFSREYLLEKLEHALDGTQLTSIFPRTSLGPDQRMLSRGAYVVSLGPIRNPIFVNPDWIQP